MMDRSCVGEALGEDAGPASQKARSGIFLDKLHGGVRMFSFLFRDPNRDWHEQRKAAYLIDKHAGQALAFVDRQLADRVHSRSGRRHWERLRTIIANLQADDAD